MNERSLTADRTLFRPDSSTGDCLLSPSAKPRNSNFMFSQIVTEIQLHALLSLTQVESSSWGYVSSSEEAPYSAQPALAECMVRAALNHSIDDREAVLKESAKPHLGTPSCRFRISCLLPMRY